MSHPSLFFFKIYLLFIYFIFGCIGSLLWHAASSLRHAGFFIAAHRLSVVVRGFLSSCGVWVSSSLVVARRLHGAWALWCAACGLQLGAQAQ